jgi:hypothetical protein
MHKFKVGHSVSIKAGQGRKLAGLYEVVRLLPADETGTPIYQVKSTEEAHLRVVAEHHLEDATQRSS